MSEQEPIFVRVPYQGGVALFLTRSVEQLRHELTDQPRFYQFDRLERVDEPWYRVLAQMPKDEVRDLPDFLKGIFSYLVVSDDKFR